MLSIDGSRITGIYHNCNTVVDDGAGGFFLKTDSGIFRHTENGLVEVGGKGRGTNILPKAFRGKIITEMRHDGESAFMLKMDDLRVIVFDVGWDGEQIYYSVDCQDAKKASEWASEYLSYKRV